MPVPLRIALATLSGLALGWWVIGGAGYAQAGVIVFSVSALSALAALAVPPPRRRLSAGLASLGVALATQVRELVLYPFIFDDPDHLVRSFVTRSGMILAIGFGIGWAMARVRPGR